MIIDFQETVHSPDTQACVDATLAGKPYRLFVDGVEIEHAWYIDTEAGIVKTYDVLRDGQYYLSTDTEALAKIALRPSCDIAMSEGGVLSETIRGKVELRTS